MQKVLWTFLLGLTIAIILWPIAPSVYDPLPVQSTYTIKYLPLFIVIFIMWVLNLGALMFLVRGGAWERLALCLVFVLVFVQFWGFKAAPWGNSIDSAWLIGHVNYLNNTATISDTVRQTLWYFDFPGLTFIGSAIQQICGADLFLAVRIYLLSSGVIFSCILYVAFLKILKTTYFSAVGVILSVASSMILGFIPNQFHPMNLSTIYIVIFFLLLVMRGVDNFSNTNIVIVFLFLVIASTIEYMFTPVFFSIVLLFIYIFRRVSSASYNIPLSIVFLPVVMFLSWEMYWTVRDFQYNVTELPQAWKAILNGQWFIPTQLILRENFGAVYPWWGNMAKLFFWLSVFGFGTLLMFWQLLHWKQADDRRRTQIAIFVGVLVTIIVGSFYGGVIGIVHGGIRRYIWIAPLVVVPALMEFLSSFKLNFVRTVLTLAGLLLILPTFFTNNDTLSVDRIYSSEIDAFKFVSTYQCKDKITILGFPSVSPASYIYVPANSIVEGAYIYGGANETEAWSRLNDNIKVFLASDGKSNVAIISVKGKQIYRQYLGVSLDNLNWSDLEFKLSSGNNIYDNGTLQFYIP